MYIIIKMKGIYQGPPHYWNQYSLVPREKYYYGYYGYYGPDTDISMYKAIDITPLSNHSSVNIEGFCSSNNSLFSIVLCIVFAWFILRMLGVL
jgi:hypothetical protein